jgi:catechol 2,3-dioxygenase-like lactoylglutathione lyase family enzyme
MLGYARAFSSISVDDAGKARQFYGEVLGLRLTDIPGPEEGFELEVAGGNPILVIPRSDHRPAAHAVLNFPVADVEEAVDRLARRGVRFERPARRGVRADAKGIARREGAAIAWFRDPAGNLLTLLTERPVRREEEWASARGEGTEE